jgi:pimeloyl-ACP methyl ester carboxylesterase
MMSFCLACLLAGMAGVGAPALVDGIEGRWKGAFTLPGDVSQDLVVTLEHTTDQNWTGQAVGLSSGIQPQPLPSLSVRGGVVSFQAILGEGSLRFRGRRSEDGRSMAGIVTGSTLGSPGVFHLDLQHAVQGQPGQLIYGTDIPVSIDELVPLTVYLLHEGNQWYGEVDFPESGVLGYPIEVQDIDGVLMLSLPSPRNSAPITLTMQPGEQIVTGLWGRGERVRVVELERGRATPILRPQVPIEPWTWISKPVQVESEGQSTLHGVLALPFGSGPFPLAVLLGDVNTDKDGTTDGHPLLLVLTDALINARIATIRIDGGDGTFKSRRRALRRWMEWCVTQPEIDARYIALIGHGEGGVVVARHAAAFDEHVAAVVLLSTPGLPGRMIEAKRLRNILEESGTDEVSRDSVLMSFDEFSTLTIQNVHAAALRESARDWMSKHRAAVGEPAPSASEIDRVVEQAQDPEWQQWLSRDPRSILPRVQGVPVFVLQGQEDATFDAGQHIAALTDSSLPRGVQLESRLLPGVNHMLQPVDIQNPMSPDRIRTTVAPSAMRVLIDWVRAQLVRERALSLPIGDGP